MKMSKTLQATHDQAKNLNGYWVEKAKLDFSLALERKLRKANMTYAALSQAMGTSAAYITKIFRGDSNMTIESMVKLARATGGQLDIRIVDASAATSWNLTHEITARPKLRLLPVTVGTHTIQKPACPDHGTWRQAA